MNILTKDGNVITAGGGAILSEGSPPPVPTGEAQVFFIDYDGTEVETWSKDEALSKTSLPTNPTHEGLIGQGWNWELSDITDYLTDYPEANVYVGQMYKTASGLTEIDVTTNKVIGKTITFNMSGNKDWGDGTTDNLLTHTYADYGDYTITCDGTSIPSSNLFGNATESNPNYFARHIRIGENVLDIGSYAYCGALNTITIPLEANTFPGSFYGNYSLISVILPRNMVTLSHGAMCENCYAIKYISISPLITYISNFSFDECYSLLGATIPEQIDDIERYFFSNCYSLTKMTIPQNVSGIDEYAFRYCYSLVKVIFSKNIQYIESEAFYNCYALTEYDFRSATQIPTLSNTNAFNKINKQAKIIVPTSLHNNWIKATNWSTYADYICFDGELISVKSLSITADNVNGRATTTTIHVTAIWETDKGIDYPETKDVTSASFPQNTSKTETVQRTITYSYEGLTATTTITQGVWIDQFYSFEDIGSYPFELSSVVNPDPTLYNGVYQSTNKGIDSTRSIVKISFVGYDTFTVYIRSYAESTYDYIIASTLDAASYPTASSDSTAKSHTSGNQQSGTAISSYKKVEYPNDGNEHFIYIVYRKDGSAASGDDRGYFLVEGLLPTPTPITDLTGYTWVGNEVIVDDLPAFELSLEFISNGNPYTAIKTQPGVYPGILGALLYLPVSSQPLGTIVYRSESGWVDQSYKTIQFASGDDVTDSDVIAWFKNNGTLTK